MISTSEIRVSVVCRDTDLDTAVRAVHDAFELGGDDEAVVYAGTGTVAARWRELPTLAVVGATGAVGTVMCELLSARKNVWGEIRLVASRALGRARRSSCRGEELTVQALAPEVFDGVDVAMFDVPDEVSRASGRRSRPRAARSWWTTPARSGWTRTCRWWCPRSTRSRCATGRRGIIANANCTTLAMIVAIAPLHREYGLRELVARLLPGGLRRRPGRRGHPARPARQGGRRPGARLAPGQRPPGGRRRPRPVPGAAGAQRGAVGRLARATAAGRPRS